jgi:hypothetical protein
MPQHRNVRKMIFFMLSFFEDNVSAMTLRLLEVYCPRRCYLSYWLAVSSEKAAILRMKMTANRLWKWWIVRSAKTSIRDIKGTICVDGSIPFIDQRQSPQILAPAFQKMVFALSTLRTETS